LYNNGQLAEWITQTSTVKNVAIWLVFGDSTLPLASWPVDDLACRRLDLLPAHIHYKTVYKWHIREESASCLHPPASHRSLCSIWSISAASQAHNSTPAAAACDGQMGQTDAGQLHTPCSAIISVDGWVFQLVACFFNFSLAVDHERPLDFG